MTGGLPLLSRLPVPRLPSLSRFGGCRPRLTALLGRVPGADDLWLWQGSRRCADRALRQYQRACGQRASRHFKSGFRKAYWDITKGRRGIVPSVPPKRYWTAYYRSPPGRRKAQDWLEGYRSGVEYAQNDGLDQFGQIATSTSSVVQTCPSDVGATFTAAPYGTEAYGMETYDMGTYDMGTNPYSAGSDCWSGACSPGWKPQTSSLSGPSVPQTVPPDPTGLPRSPPGWPSGMPTQGGGWSIPPGPQSLPNGGTVY